MARAEDCAARRTVTARAGWLPGYRRRGGARGRVKKEGTDRRVTLQVFRGWKGPYGKMLDVVTSVARAAWRRAGRDDVVDSTGKKESLRTDACSLTAPLAEALKAVRSRPARGP